MSVTHLVRPLVARRVFNISALIGPGVLVWRRGPCSPDPSGILPLRGLPTEAGLTTPVSGRP